MLKIGHRGAMGYEPENTLRSFAKALQMEVDMVELDVYVCKSGELVVFHDDTLERTTNGSGKIEDKTLSELRQLDAGQGEKIPTLIEVLNLVKRKARVNIELKGESSAKPVAEIIEEFKIRQCWLYQDFLVSSFNLEELKKFHDLSPKVRIAPVFAELPENFLDIATDMKAWSINLLYTIITPQIIKLAHSKDIKVLAWTVNDFEGMSKMRSLGVDGLFSNFPDII